MCKNQSKDSIQLYGLMLTLIYFIFLIVNIFLAGFDFKESHQNWAEGPYKVIGILQLVVVCVGFILVILGILAFKVFKENTGINAIVRKKNYIKIIFYITKKNSFQYYFYYHLYLQCQYVF
jgi:heme/copper-type cytochrome/quinol oxidase subunit 2